MTSPTRGGGLEAFAPRLIGGFGALSFAFVFLWWAAFRAAVTPAGLVLALVLNGGPALALVWAGYRLDRCDLDPRRHGRIVGWVAAVSLGFLIVNVPVMVAYPWTVEGTVSWIHWSLNLGAGGGFAVGYLEARAVQREVEATAATVRSEQLEAERQVLAYLNDLLRHEVLNSAQIVGGQASLVLEADPDERTRDRLEAIVHESDSLAAVIDDVRAMLEANRNPDARDVVDLSTLLADTVDAVGTTYPDATIDATIPDSVYVVGNEGLRWVFSNLIENAVEHNDADPHVEVSLGTTADEAVVTVTDDGPGIPEDTRETLFERKSRNHGLGLYLVRILATRYGGSVDLTETGPNGSTFAVTLPLSAPDDATDRDASTSNARAAVDDGETATDPPASTRPASATAATDPGTARGDPVPEVSPAESSVEANPMEEPSAEEPSLEEASVEESSFED